MSFLRLLFTSLLLFLSSSAHAEISRDDLRFGESVKGSIFKSASGNGLDFVGILSFIEEILLKVALPLVLVGAFLYIAYELLTADGDESKMKKAWKGVSYSAIGLITIAVAYALVSIILALQF